MVVWFIWSGWDWSWSHPKHDGDGGNRLEDRVSRFSCGSVWSFEVWIAIPLDGICFLDGPFFVYKQRRSQRTVYSPNPRA